MSEKEKRRIQAVGTVMFVLYVGVLAYFLFFSEAYGRGVRRETYCYNLIPFSEIWRFFRYRTLVGIRSYVVNVYGNILAFVPFGFFLPVAFRSVDRGILPVLNGLIFSFVVELIQLISKVGIFDVDDLILNTAGVILGYLIFRICNRMRIYGYSRMDEEKGMKPNGGTPKSLTDAKRRERPN